MQIKSPFFFFYFAVALRPNAGHGLLILDVSSSHSTTHHSRQDSSGLVISSSEGPLPDNTQHSQQTNIHAHGGIRTRYLSRRAAADLRLRPLDHWDRQNQVTILFYKISNVDTLGENIAKFRVAFFSWLFRCFPQHPRKVLLHNPALTLSARWFVINP